MFGLGWVELPSRDANQGHQFVIPGEQKPSPWRANIVLQGRPEANIDTLAALHTANILLELSYHYLAVNCFLYLWSTCPCFKMNRIQTVRTKFKMGNDNTWQHPYMLIIIHSLLLIIKHPLFLIIKHPLLLIIIHPLFLKYSADNFQVSHLLFQLILFSAKLTQHNLKFV